MIALITEVAFLSPAIGKYGKYYTFKIKYNGREAFFTSQLEDQRYFVSGKRSEFIEYPKVSKNGNKYLIVKRIEKTISVTQTK